MNIDRIKEIQSKTGYPDSVSVQQALLQVRDEVMQEQTGSFESVFDNEIVYGDALENGMYVICEAMGVSTERYDSGQADTECYMDCFREAAFLIAKAGYRFDENTGEWVIPKKDEPLITITG